MTLEAKQKAEGGRQKDYSSWVGLLLFAFCLLPLVRCAKSEQPAGAVKKARQAKPAADDTATTQELGVGSMMPAYKAESLDGSPFDLSSERGNVVLVNLWATWCGPCRFEIPQLQNLHDEYSPQRFKVIGISVDEGDNAAAEVRQFVAEQKMTYPVALDREGRLANLFQTTVLPTSAIIDRKGRIVWKHVGIVSAGDAEMLAALQKALRS